MFGDELGVKAKEQWGEIRRVAKRVAFGRVESSH